MGSSGEDAKSLATKISAIVSKLGDKQTFFELKKAAQIEAEKETTMMSSMKDDVIRGLDKNSKTLKLKNEIFHLLLNESINGKIATSKTNYMEPLSYMRKAQTSWERRIAKSINSMSSELTVPLSKRRSKSEEKEINHNWNELGVDEPDLSQYRPVYAPKDFLEIIAGVRNPNYVNSIHPNEDFLPGHWGLIQIPLRISTLKQLQDKFGEMSCVQSGLEDYMNTTASALALQNHRIKIAKKVVESGRSEIAYHFCRCGTPTTHRAEIWQLALGVSIDDLDVLRYLQLKQEVINYDLLIDNLIYKDIKLTAVNDDYYFVFEDFLYQALLVFSRDATVLNNTASTQQPPRSYIKGRLGDDSCAVTYPPNGVIPFHGFSMYAAPFCYLYCDPVKIYHVFRQFYVRHLHRLHTISSHPEGVVSLCLLFENLLQQLHPTLFRHLVNIGCQPLKIAFKWMMRAFAGYLATDQLFQLWDRVIGYGTLQLLPLLSVAIFLFRQSNLLSISSPNAIEASLSDITPMRVVPLLQMILFPS